MRNSEPFWLRVRIENGATVEREIDFAFGDLDEIRLALRNPDFVTAQRIERAINANLGSGTAEALDSRTVRVRAAGKADIAGTIAGIEPLLVQPDQIARVVIDARSGTIVIGANVRIDRVAVSQGGLTVSVKESPLVSQPEPLSIGGVTVVVPDTSVSVDEALGKFAVIDGSVSLQALVDGLNAIGVGATETISILQSIKAAGALHADLQII